MSAVSAVSLSDVSLDVGALVVETLLHTEMSAVRLVTTVVS